MWENCCDTCSRESGTQVTGKIQFGSVSRKDTLIFTYQSLFPMETVVRKMLHSSSNFMANQIFVSLGAAVYGEPGTLEKGVRATRAYIKRELGFTHYKLVEGSGLSRRNHLSAYDMLAILEKFKPHKDLLKSQDDVLYKTGSLKGIRTRAGYIESEVLAPAASLFFLTGKGQTWPPWSAALKMLWKRPLPPPRQGWLTSIRDVIFPVLETPAPETSPKSAR